MPDTAVLLWKLKSKNMGKVTVRQSCFMQEMKQLFQTIIYMMDRIKFEALRRVHQIFSDDGLVHKLY